MYKIGLFLNGLLMIEYPNTKNDYAEIVQDFIEAVEETGEIHEIKFFKEENGSYIFRN